MAYIFLQLQVEKEGRIELVESNLMVLLLLIQLVLEFVGFGEEEVVLRLQLVHLLLGRQAVDCDNQIFWPILSELLAGDSNDFSLGTSHAWILFMCSMTPL